VVKNTPTPQLILNHKMVSTLPLNEALNSLGLPTFNSNLFSSADWLNVIVKTYQTKIFVKYIKRGGKVQSFIIYSVVKNFLEWKICMCSYCDYFDCHVKDQDDWDLLIKSIRRDYPKYRIALRNLRDDVIKENSTVKELSREKYHILDIQDNLDATWKRTHDSFRSAVKQGQKSGAVIRRCDKKALKDFYNLHLQLRKDKYRLFPQPYRFFKIIWEQYMEKGNGVLLGAYDKDERFIAGNIYLICGDTLYYKFNTSSLQALKMRPNNLLFWEGIKFGKERNLKFIDLGSSGYDQHGLILFKNHTGAKMQEITHFGFAPKDYKYSQKTILKLITKTFTLPWMPNSMVRFGSSLIYPYLA